MGRLIILLGITFCLGIANVVASEPEIMPGANLAGLLQYLDQNSAELNAARLETSAAEERAEATGVLPDPSVRIEWLDSSQANGIAVNPRQLDLMKYTVLQPIPGWGKRDAQKRTAVANANWAKAQQHSVSADLHAQVRLTFAQYYRAFQAKQLNEELKIFAASGSKLAQSRYERGQGGQQEWVKAQLEESVLQSD